MDKILPDLTETMFGANFPGYTDSDENASVSVKARHATHYQWQVSKRPYANSVGYGFEDIPGATNSAYSFPMKSVTKEITKADTVTAKLPEEKPTETNPTSPSTGDTSHLALWIALLFVSGGAVTAATVISKKKKCGR